MNHSPPSRPLRRKPGAFCPPPVKPPRALLCLLHVVAAFNADDILSQIFTRMTLGGSAMVDISFVRLDDDIRVDLIFPADELNPSQDVLRRVRAIPGVIRVSYGKIANAENAIVH